MHKKKSYWFFENTKQYDLFSKACSSGKVYIRKDTLLENKYIFYLMCLALLFRPNVKIYQTLPRKFIQFYIKLFKKKCIFIEDGANILRVLENKKIMNVNIFWLGTEKSLFIASFYKHHNLMIDSINTNKKLKINTSNHDLIFINKNLSNIIKFKESSFFRTKSKVYFHPSTKIKSTIINKTNSFNEEVTVLGATSILIDLLINKIDFKLILFNNSIIDQGESYMENFIIKIYPNFCSQRIDNDNLSIFYFGRLL